MRKHVINLFLALVFVIAALLLPVTAQAAGGDCSLIVSFYIRETKEPLAGADFRLYQVAAGSADDYKLTGAFNRFSENLSWHNADEQEKLIAALSSYIAAENVSPIQTGTTDADGRLTFSGLLPGLYLALGDPLTVDGTTYTAEPVLIWLPSVAENGISRKSVVVEPKPDKEKPTEPPTPSEPPRPSDDPTPTPSNDPSRPSDSPWPSTPPSPSDSPGPSTPPGTSDPPVPSNPPGPSDPPSPSDPPDDSERLPQTGQLWWPVPLLTIVGLWLFAIGALLYAWKEEPEKLDETDKFGGPYE